MDPTLSIGWIGLGKMGFPMASNILSQGHEMHVFDLNPEPCRQLASNGAHPADSISSLGERCQVIASIVSDDQAVEAVARELLPSMRPNAIFLEMSTISPMASARVAKMADEAGVSYLRAPVSGTVGNARAHTLTVMASGPKDAYDLCRPLFPAFSHTDLYLGPADEARWMKLVVNLQVGALAAMLGEALTLGRAGGLDWKMMLEVVGQSVITSPLLKVKLPYLIQRDFTPAFTAKQMIKDFDLILGAMANVGASAPIASWVRQLLTSMGSTGRGEMDYFGCLEVYEMLAGLEHSGNTDDQS